MSHHTKKFHERITFAGSLIAIGIVFGDIGTSPLYTLNSVFHGLVIDETLALGTFSCIFWTLFFQTTLKYVIITLQADNHGEGGIFSLYALIRKSSPKFLLFVAIAGGSFLMADGIITPPISVASAIEGVRAIYPDLDTVPIVLVIIVLLFVMQQFGTDKIGKIFGPVMLFWFGFIGIIGVMAMNHHWEILKALNPYYAYQLLAVHPGGFWLLGGVFLCTTGAEALYSDMGHCGKNNIRISWFFIQICLILSYGGQTAWLMEHIGETVGDISPFYHIIPPQIYVFSIGIATLATIIASQALISGCFTLINEAIQLNIWPKLLVHYPSNVKGQIYIPAINWILMTGCLAMVLHFKESEKMEAAFGLSVTLTMLTTTVLINNYLKMKKVHWALILLITGLFFTIEMSFLIANLQKIKQGGWITLTIGFSLFALMYFWQKGKTLKNSLIQYVDLEVMRPILEKLSCDMGIQKTATNLIYLTGSKGYEKIEKQITDSILNYHLPKRADIYWFVHLNVTDEPFGRTYSVNTLALNDLYHVEFNLGFREDPRIGFYFREVVVDMIARNEVKLNDSHEKEYQNSLIGDVKFITMESFLSYDNDLPFWKNLVMRVYYFLNRFSSNKAVVYGLDENLLEVERYPILFAPLKSKIKRIEE